MATSTTSHTAAPTARDCETAAGPTAPAEALGPVDLIGFLDGGPAGFIRLFRDPARIGIYADIKLQSVISLFPETGADTATGQTVLTVHGDAEILICTPVQAARIGDSPSVVVFWPRR